MAGTPIFHLALPDEWAEAERAGRYERSTRGRSLAEEGFIHCSFADQVVATANRFYADLTDLVLLTIDPGSLSSPVMPEPVPGGEVFPHVYGPIAVGAVVAADPWHRSGATWLPER